MPTKKKKKKIISSMLKILDEYLLFLVQAELC